MPRHIFDGEGNPMIVILVLTLIIGWHSDLLAQAPFYQGKTITIAVGTGVASTGYYMPKLMEEVLGSKFDIVSGYVSGQDIDLAVERGELQCRAFTITAYFAREPFISWRKKNFTNVLIQTGTRRDSRIKDSPTIYELMDRYKTTDAGRALAKVILASGDLGHPIVAPPGVPADRIKILRDSFEKTIQDPAPLAEAERRRLEIDPTPGDEMELWPRT
jgi:hypothetical protein